MKQTLTLFCLMTVISFAQAQNKARPAKELEALLPKSSLSGFTREKPSTSSMNMSTDQATLSVSLASVNYQAETKSISIQIADYVTDKQSYSALCTPLNMNISFENDEGKSETKSYKSNRLLESISYAAEGTGGNCALTLCIKDRFYVSINYDGSTDLQPLYRFLDEMNLNAL
jgi:hypothetical protein